MILNINYQLIIFYFYVWTFALESPVRYVLYSIGIPWMIYTRDLLIGIVCLIFLHNVFVKKAINKKILVFIILFFIACMVGYIYIESLLQVLFGCKVFLPFFFGIVISKENFSNLSKMKNFYLAIFFISCIGIIFNFFYDDLPWIGMQYDLGNQEIELQRDWATEGIPRLSGFSRASFNVAILISYSAIWIFIFKKNFLRIGIIGIIGMICIALTTAKGAIVGYFMCFLCAFFQNMKYIEKVIWFSFMCIFITMIFLPIMSIYSDCLLIDHQNMEFGILLFASFNDRLLNTWPNAFEIIEKNGNWFWGRGIGGIGSAQKFFDFNVPYNPADNFFVILYVFFGVISIFLLLYILKYAGKLKFDNQNNKFSMFVLIAMFSGGIVSSTLDSGITALYLGLLIGHSFSSISPEL